MAKTTTKKTTKKKTTAATAAKTAKKATSPKAPRSTKGSTKAAVAAKATDAEEGEVAVERRASSSERRNDDRRTKSEPVVSERRTFERREKVARRRQIDPTTCERDYTDEEIQFMAALDEYKRKNGRMFPTCSEILEVVRGLGYVKASQAAEANDSVEEITAAAGEQPSVAAPIALEADAPEGSESFSF